MAGEVRPGSAALGTPEGASASLRDNERGAIMLMGVFMSALLIAALYYVVGIGDAVAHREAMQDGSDAAAFSAAITMARGMNFIVLINLLMAALVLIILILKLIVTLLGIAALVLAAVFMYAMAATVAGWAYDVNDVANEVQDIVFQVLEVCHYVEYLVKVVTPAAAELATVADSIAHASPPVVAAVVLPERWTLPVEPGSYAELCGKAGEWAGTLVAGLLPLPKVAIKGISSGISALAKALSFWFCGDGGSTPPMDPATTPEIEYELDRPLPLTQNSKVCERQTLDGDVTFRADAPGEKYDIHRRREYDPPTQPCGLAERERHAIIPSDDDGSCRDECVPSKLEANLVQARHECNPKESRDPRFDGSNPGDYMYSTATIVDVYKWDKATKVFSLVDADVQSVRVHGRRDEDPANETEYEHHPIQNPCIEHRFWNAGRDVEAPWNLTTSAPNRTADGRQIRRPVCGATPTGLPTADDLDRLNPPPNPETTYSTDPYSAVLDIYGCAVHIKEKRKISMGSVNAESFNQTLGTSEGQDDTGDEKSPYFVEAGLGQGDEAFQVRSLSFGRGHAGAFADRIIKHSAWGRQIEWNEIGLDFVETLNLANFSVSQAEFFFEPPVDGKNLQEQAATRRNEQGDVLNRATDNESWNWEMGWRARLVPFTLPSSGGEDEGDQGNRNGQANRGSQRTSKSSRNPRNGSGIANTGSNRTDAASSNGFDSLGNNVGDSLASSATNGLNGLSNDVTNTLNSTVGSASNSIDRLASDANDLGAPGGSDLGSLATTAASTFGNDLADGASSLGNTNSPYGDVGLLSSGAFSDGDLTEFARSLLPDALQFPPSPAQLCFLAGGDIAETCEQVLTSAEMLEGMINH